MKIRKNHLGIVIAIAIIVIFVLASNVKCQIPIANVLCEKKDAKLAVEKNWNVGENGILSFQSRQEVLFMRQNLSETGDLSISKVIYKSQGSDVFGILVLPKKINSKLPAIVLIPGAGVSKESELSLAKNISTYGIAVFTYDQRGVGETKGGIADLQTEYQSFVNGIEPNYYKLVYDALIAHDLLASAEFVDTKNILMAGESLGGRIAMIASAIEPNIKGTLVISSSGMNVQREGGEADQFLLSLDPDNYLSKLAPRKIVMMHNQLDKNVVIQSAVQTYLKAQDPKRFVLVNDTTCNHGYCESMHKGLLAALDFLYN